MPSYHAPLEDMSFLLEQVFKVDELWGQMPALSEVNFELATAILSEADKFASGRLAPLNQIGDQQGCVLNDGVVKTPDGFKEAWAEYAESGWVGLAGNPEFEGQGLPKMLSLLVEEMIYGANCSFQLYGGLTAGAALLIDAHASDAIKSEYLPKLYSGQWCGTMCLTEPHAGTDLGLIRTKAKANDDGSYQITGSKIFITGGDQDLTENIIHLVLAKAEGSPDSVKGISVFLVPKFIDGQANGVSVGALEHKMGIKGSATCVMNFDDAKGWLIGELNRGINNMFTMMNYERLSIGLQGLGLGEVSLQNALEYARERKQSKAPGASAGPSSIVELPDVQRMLLQQKCFVEAGRCFALYVGKQLDCAKYSEDVTMQSQAAKRVALLTPVAKAFLTDKGFDACVAGQQVLGGHGYIGEWGLEQYVRDARIGQIYEGTNGIQALDLLGRKIVADGGQSLNDFFAEILAEVESANEFDYAEQINQQVNELQAALNELAKASDLAVQINGLAVETLHALGHVCFSYMWLLQHKALQGVSGDLANNKHALISYWFNWQSHEFSGHLARIKNQWQASFATSLIKK